MSKPQSQTNIKDFILDYVREDESIISNDKVREILSLYIENDNASKLSGRADILGATNGIRFKYICNYMCKLNKEIKKFIDDDAINDLKMSKTSISDVCNELSSYILLPGIYYAELEKGKDKFVVLDISYTATSTKFDNSTYDEYYRDFSLYFIGKKHVKMKQKFLKKLKMFEDSVPKYDNDIIRYRDGRGIKPTIFKPFDQLVFTRKKEVLEYIDNWKRNIPKYDKYGMIPKLSILLYGNPGTGKSSFCKALAKYLDIPAITPIPASYFDPDNTQIQIPSFSFMENVFVIDDIDCIGRSREDDSSVENSQIISSLLEFLDNPPTFYYKVDDKYYLISIVCATTNYIDRLDPAVKRYGRFDLKIEMKNFNKDDAQEMCDLYNLKLEDIYKEEIKENSEFSPAYIQSLCMENIDNNLKSKGE